LAADLRAGVLAQRGNAHGEHSLLDFIAPGILAQSVLFVAIFYGINVIWSGTWASCRNPGQPDSTRGTGARQGLFRRYPHSIAGCHRLRPFAAARVKLDWRPLSLLNVVVVVVLASTLFSTFSLIIACIVKTRERFMGVGQVLTMPLFLRAMRFTPPPSCPAG